MSDIIQSSIIPLEGKEYLETLKYSGKVVAQCLSACKDLLEASTPNLSCNDLNQVSKEIIEKAGCTATFFGYKGFPGYICTSVNKQMVHGIPTDYIIQPGDVVKIDLGATTDGIIADAALTAIYGEPLDKKHVELMSVCQKSLHNAINRIKIGNRLGSIGSSINYVVKQSRFGLITNYGGHGIERNMPHAPPFVANKASAQEGPRLQPGMTLAIEPMLTIGEPVTTVSPDGWTVTTPGVSAHYEHTIFIEEDKTHVITQWEDKI